MESKHNQYQTNTSIENKQNNRNPTKINTNEHNNAKQTNKTIESKWKQ